MNSSEKKSSFKRKVAVNTFRIEFTNNWNVYASIYYFPEWLIEKKNVSTISNLEDVRKVKLKSANLA